VSDPSEIVLGIKTRGGFLSTSVLVSEHSRHGVDGHVLCPIRIVDGPNSVDCRNRWTYRMLGWEPSWGERSVGRPAIRWEDRLEGFGKDRLTFGTGLHVGTDRLTFGTGLHVGTDRLTFGTGLHVGTHRLPFGTGLHVGTDRLTFGTGLHGGIDRLTFGTGLHVGTGRLTFGTGLHVGKGFCEWLGQACMLERTG
jgi:hypothetical protein